MQFCSSSSDLGVSVYVCVVCVVCVCVCVCMCMFDLACMYVVCLRSCSTSKWLDL